MRDALLLGVFFAALPYVLKRPWAAVLLWTWISTMNPHKLAYGFAVNLPFAALAAAAAVISWMMARDKMKLVFTPPVTVLVMFILWMCMTTVFAYFPDRSAEFLSKVLKIQFMTLFALAALRHRKHIEYFIWVNALSVGFYGIKGGLFTILSGGKERVWGPPGGFFEGNNELALALVMTIPLLNYLRVVATDKRIRSGLLVAMLLCAVSALGSQSRGALLAILAMSLVLWSRSDQKVATAVVFVLLGMVMIAFMPDSWDTRMRTMQTYQEDGSAMGRINAWWMTYNLAKANFLGGGFDIYTPTLYALFAPEPQNVLVAHSIYFSVLGEHGFGGLFLFLLMWTLTWGLGSKMRKLSRGQADLQWVYHLAGMCQVSLIGYAVGGAFLSLAYFDLPYNVLVILSTTYCWLKFRPKDDDGQGAFGALAPSSQLREAAKRKISKWQ